MRKILFRQVRVVLLASAALLTPSAFAADYTVSTPTTVQNGNAGNMLDGNDSLLVQAGGSITTAGDHAIRMTNAGNDISVIGSISTTGDNALGILGADNSVVNISGSISTIGIGSFGILFDTGNTLVNSGNITTNGIVTYGIYAGEGNKITNSGSIATTGDVSASVFLVNRNTLVNSGNISTQSISAFGIFSAGDLNIINNNGVINTSGQVSDGIFIDGNTNILNNSGTISTLGMDSSGIFIGVNSIDTIISNTGTILTGDSAAFITGTGTAGTILTNSGKIVSTQGGPSIFFGATDSALNLAAPSFIGGTMNLGEGTFVDMTTGRSHSVLWDFSTHGASAPIMNFSGDVPWAYDVATEQFATVDPTALSAAPQITADMLGSISDIVRNNTDGNEWWINGFGGYAEYGATGIYNDFTGSSAGVISGASSQVGNGLSVGAMAGYGVSNLQVNSKWEISQTVQSKGIVGALYANGQLDMISASFALLGGGMNNDSSRLVNDNLAAMGIDHATANFNSWFLAPELRLSADIASGEKWTISPSVMVRYTHQSIDGYIEAGSNANATIAARNVQMLEGNIELAASRQLEGGTLTLAGGLDYHQALGTATQNIVLLGETIALPLNMTSTTIGYISTNASFDLGSAASLNLSARTAFGANGHKSISGSVGLGGKF